MSLTIHPRAEWGFTGWANGVTPGVVFDGTRTEFFTHYEGGTPTRDSGAAAMRSIHADHIARGWAGIGYNFVVFQDGSIWEGRGWGLRGAHCPNHNTSGWGVQVHVGGDQHPTDAALRSQRALYDEACRRAGKRLAMKGHQDGWATDCPGTILEAWVRAGMPAPAQPKPPEPVPVPVNPTGGLDMLIWAKSSSVSVDAAGNPVIKLGDVFHCAVDATLGGVRWHIPGSAKPLTVAADAANMLLHADGQDILEAWPTEVKPAPVVHPA